ncbi:DTW domain-containing protein [Psychrosphaera sp. F3M07]|uniref:tRNA-uridine aminocarboxypropyltransferase n=1 Tax=Psychrosphaera sp. F3M07 TaxID=2841560 RepID=UPI001C094480|nr:DTW domain-containing protein [Psychrosphaera sp. F3M07]MBU2916686.1 DTW domain-containing protein [Psychrosphaera sp. F3M07]
MTTNNTNLEQGDKPDIKDSVGFKNNSVRVLRDYQRQFSTREFKARGYLLKRCESCLLAESKCVCDLVPQLESDIGVCMLMYHAEYYKPSNTGQLICAVIKDNYAFRWQRTELESTLEQLLTNELWYPIIVFPHDNVEPERQLQQVPDSLQLQGKRPLLIFLDGTWRQAKKMFVKSPYLSNLPVLQVSDIAKGNYQLREAYHEHHLSTVEVAAEIFKQVGEVNIAENLNHLFEVFKDGYKEFKR